MDVTFNDFQANNNWKLDNQGISYKSANGSSSIPQFIVDSTTGRKYLNEEKWCVRIKCLGLAIITPLYHIPVSLVNIVYRIIRLVSFCHFWIKQDLEVNDTFKVKCGEVNKDLLRIIATPFSIYGLEMAAIYGIFKPYDGRKLYASIERAMYGIGICAPCFQPEAKYHAFGGNINQRHAF